MADTSLHHGEGDVSHEQDVAHGADTLGAFKEHGRDRKRLGAVEGDLNRGLLALVDGEQFPRGAAGVVGDQHEGRTEFDLPLQPRGVRGNDLRRPGEVRHGGRRRCVLAWAAAATLAGDQDRLGDELERVVAQFQPGQQDGSGFVSLCGGGEDGDSGKSLVQCLALFGDQVLLPCEGTRLQGGGVDHHAAVAQSMP